MKIYRRIERAFEKADKIEKEMKEFVRSKFDEVCKEYIKKYNTNIIQFDWDNGDAPAVVYSPEDDITDCYIKKMEISVLNDGSVFVKCDLYAYYQQETYTNCELRDLNEYDLKDIAWCVLSQLQYGRYIPNDSDNNEE